MKDFTEDSRVTAKSINYASTNNFSIDYSDKNFDIGFYVYYDNVVTTSPLNYVYITAELIQETRSSTSQTSTILTTSNLVICESVRPSSSVDSLNKIYAWRSGALCLPD